LPSEEFADGQLSKMRYARLKRSLDAEGGSGADQPATGSRGGKRKAANGENAEPQKRKTKVKSVTPKGEDRENFAGEDGEAGEEQEQV
jgi:hypothetical protein